MYELIPVVDKEKVRRAQAKLISNLNISFRHKREIWFSTPGTDRNGEVAHLNDDDDFAIYYK